MTSWTVALGSLPMRFPWAGILEWVAVPFQGIFSTQGEPTSPALARSILALEPPGKAIFELRSSLIKKISGSFEEPTLPTLRVPLSLLLSALLSLVHLTPTPTSNI